MEPSFDKHARGRRLIGLMVEDDPALQEELRRRAARLDIDAILARDYYSALARLAEVTPDIVVVSLRLPNESGYRLCELIRRSVHLSAVPIVVTYESASIEDMANALEAGASALLKKPFSTMRFVSSVRAALGPDEIEGDGREG
jgi:DNA-binding response OmpR family regulator